MKITKIVLTGGPCAGKTTAMSWIQNGFVKMGYTVLFVPETATELIGGGVAPWTCGSNLDYQRGQMRLQMEKEQIFVQAAETMAAEKILIVCDRGAMDNRAYMTETEFSQLLEELGTTEIQLRDQYDAVFHLVTAAKGAEMFYTNANNEARRESPEEAAALDDKLISAWTGHPHLRIIDNATDFNAKLQRLMAEISAFLGEPAPMEIERKFLIQYPDVTWLKSLPNCRKVDIIQTYLLSKEGDELRVRQRGENGSYIYFKTLKRRVSDTTRVEIEERLSQNEYLGLLMEADPDKRPIRKTRYCLTYDNQYFEIDLYPFWKNQAIVEIELRDEKQEIRFPRGLRVICEVTGDERFQNAALASLPRESNGKDVGENKKPMEISIIKCRIEKPGYHDFWIESQLEIRRMLPEVRAVISAFEDAGFVAGYTDVGGGVDELTHTGHMSYHKEYPTFADCLEHLEEDFGEEETRKRKEYGFWLSSLNFEFLSVELFREGTALTIVCKRGAYTIHAAGWISDDEMDGMRKRIEDLVVLRQQ